MLALPLSCFYSVVIFAGLSVGLGVAILTLGLPLVLMMGFWRWMARFERWLGERLLGVSLPLALPAQHGDAAGSRGCSPAPPTSRPGRTSPT